MVRGLDDAAATSAVTTMTTAATLTTTTAKVEEPSAQPLEMPLQPSEDPPSSPGSTSVDSDILDQLEIHAETDADTNPDGVYELLIEQAEALFPDVDAMIDNLKQHGMVDFMARYVEPNPGQLHHLLTALRVWLPLALHRAEVPESQLLPILKTALRRILRQRERLKRYSTSADALDLIARSRRIVVLSGAGISVSCGIPDFRSRNGIYAQLQRDATLELDDPTDMFDKQFFLARPHVFFSFAHRIFPSNFRPSPSHRFIKLLEDRGSLLRNYTQNIDTLEQLAGIRSVLPCHGSFASATCTDPRCGYRADGATIKADIFAQRVPQCPRCAERKRKAHAVKQKSNKRSKKDGATSWRRARESDSEDADDSSLAYGIMKPDITFFGEKLSPDFDRAVFEDRSQADLIIVMGTSLRVAPVSDLLTHMPHSVPLILINKTPILHTSPDIQLLGDSDRIVRWICDRLQWTLPPIQPVKRVVGDVAPEVVASDLAEGEETEARGEGHSEETISEPTRLMGSHFWLFDGAEVGTLPEYLEAHGYG